MARLTKAESLAMDSQAPFGEFFWSVEVANGARDYVRTTEVRLAVQGAPS